MKKIYFLGLAVLAISTFSCSKDDSPSENQTPASLEGKWSFNKIDYSLAGGPVEDYPFNNEGCTKNFLELKANNTTSEGTYIGDACELEVYAGTWAKAGEVITVYGEDFNTVYTLVSVTATELKLKEGNSTIYVFSKS